MTVPKKSDKIDQFRQYAWDLYRHQIEHHNANISIDVDDWGNGRLYIVLKIEGDITALELRAKAVPLAIEWRDKLNEFQGRDIDSDLFMQSIQQHFESGKTYAQIADIVNAHLVDLLHESHKLSYRNVPEAWRLSGKVLTILTILNAGRHELPEKRGRRNKNNERKRQKWIDTVMYDAQTQIAHGKGPFDIPQYPVSKYDVEYSIRQWRKKRTTEKT